MHVKREKREEDHAEAYVGKVHVRTPAKPLSFVARIPESIRPDR
jgi:hypothetical protein